MAALFRPGLRLTRALAVHSTSVVDTLGLETFFACNEVPTRPYEGHGERRKADGRGIRHVLAWKEPCKPRALVDFLSSSGIVAVASVDPHRRNFTAAPLMRVEIGSIPRRVEQSSPASGAVRGSRRAPLPSVGRAGVGRGAKRRHRKTALPAKIMAGQTGKI